MPQFLCGPLPDVLYHGSPAPLDAGTACLAAGSQHWWRLIDWSDYDEGFEGEDRTAYANLAWEYLGLRDADRADAPDWARDIRDVEDLGSRIGILFVTDDPEIALSRYGNVHEIDMTSASILEAIPDPNPGTYAAWILLVDAGGPIPLRSPAEDRPMVSPGR